MRGSHLYTSYMKQMAAKAGGGAMAEGRVASALVHAAQAIEDRWQGALARVGLSTAKLGALTVLVEAGEPLRLSELAARLTCVGSAITPLGIERQAAGAQEMERVQKELGSALSAIDLAALERVLSKLK